MKSVSKVWNAIFFLSISVITLVFLPKLFIPGSFIYQELLTLKVVLFIGAPIKILFLFLASFFSFSCVLKFTGDNPVRPAWVVMTTGLFFCFLGQCVLGYYQLFLSIPTPFPSGADLFFLTGSFFLIVHGTKQDHRRGYHPKTLLVFDLTNPTLALRFEI